MVYAPIGRPFSVRMGTITGGTVKAWWFDPRTGRVDGDRHLSQWRRT